jgi:predicted kinase
VRFSIDEWMVGLFGPDAPQPLQFEWMIERIDRCEARIAAIALQLAHLGTPSVLDLGFTRHEHRQKFVRIAREAGLEAQLHFVDVPAEERWRRVGQRNAEKGASFHMEVTREMFDFMEGIWEPPAEPEMADLAGLRR